MLAGTIAFSTLVALWGGLLPLRRRSARAD
jgi:hypothetical protein